MNYSKNDDEIVKMESENQKNNHYQKYIQKRFTVHDIYEAPNGMCANIHDKEVDDVEKYHEGDKLADGKIQLIAPEGVVFKAPKAHTPPFSLMSKKELLPVKGDKIKKDRLKMEEEYHQMHESDEGPIIMISVMDSGEPYGLA
jgi:hypothetical protein